MFFQVFWQFFQLIFYAPKFALGSSGSIKFNYSYLVIAKPTMLNNEFKDIKETLFKEFSKIR